MNLLLKGRNLEGLACSNRLHIHRGDKENNTAHEVMINNIRNHHPAFQISFGLKYMPGTVPYIYKWL